MRPVQTRWLPVPTLAALTTALGLDGVLLYLVTRPADCSASGGGDPVLGELLVLAWAVGPIAAVGTLAARDMRLGRGRGRAMIALGVLGCAAILAMHALVALEAISQSLSCGFF